MLVRTKKILVVGESSFDIKVFRDGMREKGFETIEDPSGCSCLEYSQVYQPDLIIVNSNLPYTAGAQVVKTLKSQESIKHIPVLGVNNCESVCISVAMIEAGCFDSVEYPFNMNALLEKISSQLDDVIKNIYLLGIRKVKFFESEKKMGDLFSYYNHG